MTWNDIFVFFYIDDIVFTHREKNKTLVQQIVKNLREEFELSENNFLHWFLEIEIIWNREKKLIWLSQSSYIDKIANLAVFKQSDAIFMSKNELFFYNNVALLFQINLYQQKISFLMYATVITCSDIAFAVSWLTHFLINLKSLHQVITDQTFLYLKRYQNLNLQLNEDDEYIVINNASFADNTADHKSFQSYAIKLFRNLIEWQTNKQIIIIILITKAELMTLLQTVHEEIYIE